MKKSKFEPENYVFYNGGTCMDKIYLKEKIGEPKRFSPPQPN